MGSDFSNQFYSSRISKMLLISVILLLLLHSSQAKKVSDDFKLSGVNTEYVVTSFAIAPVGAKVKFTLTSPIPYDREVDLSFRIYRDDQWPKFNKLQLCTDKVRLAHKTFHIQFTERNGNWQSETRFEITEEDTYQGEKLSKRNHYWYFVVDDCSLEQYFRDDRIPEIHVEFSVQNFLAHRSTGEKMKFRSTHLSSDDVPLVKGHAITTILGILVSLRLFINIIRRLRDREKNHSVHAAVLWVWVAASVDAWSSFFELVHLSLYHQDGVGSYAFDCLAALSEAATDSLLMMMLLSIAAGWTLPSSVITIVNTNASPVQKLLEGLSHPISKGLRGPVGMLAGIILIFHLSLALWGRTYNDDFESYHELEHWPGRVLMWVRVMAALLFVSAVQQMRTKFSGKFQKFYTAFAVAGIFWFLSLPVLTLVCNSMIPYRLRKPVIFIGATFVQTLSVVLLAWLVTTHSTAYHQLSRMTTGRETLSDSLDIADHQHPGSPRAWKLGKKAKVALD